MFRKSALALILIFILSSISFSQEKYSLQFNGGVISPLSSSKGLRGTVQLNYIMNDNISFYFYSGYSQWDKYKVKFQELSSGKFAKENFDLFIEDDHHLIPVYLGSKINFNTVSLFTTFIDFEIGYSYTSFNSYSHNKLIDDETGEVIGYKIDPASKENIKENLFGVGIGLGLAHPMTGNLNLVIEAKLNSHTGAGYEGLFSHKGTYLTYTAGFDFSL